jgi:hypothetical protein
LFCEATTVFYLKGFIMAPPDLTKMESDPRFPSGGWTGFFIQPWIPGRHKMSLDLTFQQGRMEAQGNDWVGPFTFSGSYDPIDGKCNWTKKYLGKHQVSYAGVNEGNGIWGVWEIRQLWGWYHDRGGFHIWPEGMTPAADADLTERALRAEIGRMPPFSVLIGLFGTGLVVALLILFRFFGYHWIERLFR